MSGRTCSRRSLFFLLVVAMAGLCGIAVVALMGWDLRHDELLLRFRGEFALTGKERLSLLRECIGYTLAFSIVAGLCAIRVRRRVGMAAGPAFAWLLGSGAVGWGAGVYVFGRWVPTDASLGELWWITVAALAAGVFVYRFRSLVQPPRHEDEGGERPAPSPGDGRHAAQWGKLAAVIVVVYIATFGAISVMRHNAFGTDLHDLGLYDQMLWNTLRGRPFRCTLWQITPGPDLAGGYDLERFGYNFLAEHLMPILLVLTPFYALWQDPRTLLVLQTLALGLAGFGLYRLAARLVASRALACLFVFSFLMNPLVQQTNVKDFHADAFEPLFFFLAVAALAGRRMWLYWPSIILLLACKEDVSLTVMALGVFLAWRERRVRLGLATLALGVAWYAVGIQVVMGHFRGGEPLRQLYRYSHLIPGEKESVSAILQTILLNPLYVVQVALEQARVASFLRLFAPLAFLPFLAPSALLFALPPLASNLLSNWDTQYSLDLHYSIAILGPLYVAALCGARNWLYPDRANEPFFGSSPGGNAATEVTVRGVHRPRSAAMVAFLLAAISLFGYRYGRFPGGKRFDPEDIRKTDHHRLAYRYIAALNVDDGISAHSAIGTHLTGRKTIYVFPELQDARLVLVDTRDHPWPLVSREAYEARVRELLQSGEWGVVRDYEDGFLLMKRGAETSRNPSVLGRLNFSPYR